MRQDIREQLLDMAEQDYQKFSAALIPGVENMLGIRLPQLRKLAKDIAKTDWKEERLSKHLSNRKFISLNKMKSAIPHNKI